MPEELSRNNSSLQGCESERAAKVRKTSANQESSGHTFSLAASAKLASVATLKSPQVINHPSREANVRLPSGREHLLRGLHPGFPVAWPVLLLEVQAAMKREAPAR